MNYEFKNRAATCFCLLVHNVHTYAQRKHTHTHACIHFCWTYFRNCFLISFAFFVYYSLVEARRKSEVVFLYSLNAAKILSCYYAIRRPLLALCFVAISEKFGEIPAKVYFCTIFQMLCMYVP